MSSVLELTFPAAEPISLADAKNWLKIPAGNNTDDILVQRLVKASRRYIERCTGLTLAQRKFVQYQDGFPFFPYFQSPYAPLFGAAFPFYFGYGPISSYPYPAIGGLQNQMTSPFEVRALKNPITAITGVNYIGTDGEKHSLVPFKDFVPDFATGRIMPLPGQRWPVSTIGPNTVEIYFSAGYLPDELSIGQQNAEIESSPGWEPDTTVAQYAYLIDPNDNVWMQLTAPSGATGAGPEPPWGSEPAPGEIVHDGTAEWICLGPVTGEWDPQTEYVQYTVVFDPNGNLQTCIVSAFTSQNADPTFSQTLGLTTVDNSVVAWRCLGEYEGVMPNPPDQPSSYTKIINIPEDIEVAIYLMLSHYYFNREPVTNGSVSKVPHGVEDLILSVRDLGFGLAANLQQ